MDKTQNDANHCGQNIIKWLICAISDLYCNIGHLCNLRHIDMNKNDILNEFIKYASELW